MRATLDLRFTTLDNKHVRCVRIPCHRSGLKSTLGHQGRADDGFIGVENHASTLRRPTMSHSPETNEFLERS